MSPWRRFRCGRCGATVEIRLRPTYPHPTCTCNRGLRPWVMTEENQDET